MLWDYMKATFMIVLVIAAAYYATKFVAFKSSSPRGNANIRVHSSVSLGRDRRLVIAEIGEKIYILGVTPQHIELVDRMTRDELGFDEPDGEEPPLRMDFRKEFLERLRGTYQDRDKK